MNQLNTLLLRLSIPLSILFLLIACDGTSSPPPNSPESQPNLSISFPPKLSTTEAGSVIVRGSIVSPEKVSKIIINGSEHDASEQWQIKLPLQDGENEILLEYVTNDGERRSLPPHRIIKRLYFSPESISPKALVFADSETLIASSPTKRELVKLNVINHSTVSLQLPQEEGYKKEFEVYLELGNEFLAVDKKNQVAYMQRGLDGRLKIIDLQSGDIKDYLPKIDLSDLGLSNYQLDEERAWLWHYGPATGFVAVDLKTGKRNVQYESPQISLPINAKKLDQLETLDRVSNFIVDAENSRIFAVTNKNEILAYYAPDQIYRLTFAENSDDLVIKPTSVLFDKQRNRLLIGENQEALSHRSASSFIALDLDSGEQSTFVSPVELPYLSGSRNALEIYQGATIDPAGENLYSYDEENSIVRINLETGNKIKWMQASYEDVNQDRLSPSYSIYDQINKTNITRDKTNGTLWQYRYISGEKRQLLTADDLNITGHFAAFSIDAAQQTAIVATTKNQEQDPKVLFVDLKNKKITRETSLEYFASSRGEIILNKETGNLRIFNSLVDAQSGETIGNVQAPSGSFEVFDPYFVPRIKDRITGAVYSLYLNNDAGSGTAGFGTRATLAKYNSNSQADELVYDQFDFYPEKPGEHLNEAEFIAINAGQRKIYMINHDYSRTNTGSRLLEFDLATQKQNVIFKNDHANQYRNVWSLMIDEQHDVAIIGDATPGRFLAVDLVTKDAVFIFK